MHGCRRLGGRCELIDVSAATCSASRSKSSTAWTVLERRPHAGASLVESTGQTVSGSRGTYRAVRSRLDRRLPAARHSNARHFRKPRLGRASISSPALARRSHGFCDQILHRSVVQRRSRMHPLEVGVLHVALLHPALRGGFKPAVLGLPLVIEPVRAHVWRDLSSHKHCASSCL